MTAAANPVRILILGTGNMAASHVAAYQKIPGVQVVAGVDRRTDILAGFCGKFGIPDTFATLEEAVAWGEFDAISNVTPDAAHHPTTLLLLNAGKHVLCEKPLATNAADALEMAELARAKGLIGMVNLTYRNVAVLQKAAELVEEGAIGALKHFEASYLQSWLSQPAWGDWRTESQWLWRLSSQHGSKGVLGDVGIHILDFVTFAARSEVGGLSCRLKTFDKAEGGRIGEYTLDANDSFTLQAELENGALGTISATRYASGHLNDLRLRLYGDNGGLEVIFEKQVERLRICRDPDLEAAEWREVTAEPVPTVYERFVNSVREGTPTEPGFDHGARLQQALDAAERSNADQSRFLNVGP
ncbi:Gfo/Idh/MocA family protein [Roseibium salinum]|uniref:Gfo/Idh/MocA family oxidoreductase n=1 Tax=Roseibium salinum TaxID=1604349 RepID=A0ABT3R7G5_9HYPH|nr:Gfo/Idh/MocA family oxidoreductase [Roseibium sp. DSM 29163]MCX2725074.1 Gfo/Idh/MocA family oxidoreductase [Roseibium sp. DSM 29163]